MNIFQRISVYFFTVILLFSVSPAAADAKPTATPQPLQISRSIDEPPDVIQSMINIALAEWESVSGKKLPRSNKYTRIFNEYEWGWCAGFTSWCAQEADVPRGTLNTVLKLPEGEADSVFTCFTTSPGKYLRAFLYMHRTTMIPQKGYWILFGDRSNYTVHIGLVCDVRPLENGKYRLTTIEGNMKNSVMKYMMDYEPVDVYYEQNHRPTVSNLMAIPEEEREQEESNSFTYRLRVSDTDGSDWYVTCFLMTWVPEDDFTVVDEEVSP